MNWKYLLPVCFILSIVSCQTSNEIGSGQSSDLFTTSSTSLLFDTLFEDQQATSQTLWIRNESDENISLSSIKLQNGTRGYDLIINGQESNTAENVFLPKSDSILIVVSIEPEASSENSPFLIKDTILINSGDYTAEVCLTAYGQSANYISGSVCDTLLDSEIPFVITDSLYVPVGCRLTVSSKSILYFDRDASLIVAGELLINGTYEDPVCFSSAHQVNKESLSIGYWRGIEVQNTHGVIDISYCTIQNARTGLECFASPDTSSVIGLSYVVVKNMSDYGIKCQGSKMMFYNGLIYDCARSAIAVLGQGDMTIVQSTLFGSEEFMFRSGALIDSRKRLSDEDHLSDQRPSVNLYNSIVWGNQNEELDFDSTDYQIKGSLTKSLQPIDTTSNLVNDVPLFNSSFQRNFGLDALSPAKTLGFSTFVSGPDLDNTIRNSPPSAGAFE